MTVNVPEERQPYLFIWEDLCRDYRCGLEAVSKTLDPGSHQVDETTDVAKDNNVSFFVLCCSNSLGMNYSII